MVTRIMGRGQLFELLWKFATVIRIKRIKQLYQLLSNFLWRLDSRQVDNCLSYQVIVIRIKENRQLFELWDEFSMVIRRKQSESRGVG